MMMLPNLGTLFSAATLPFFAQNQCLFGIARGLESPSNKTNITRGADNPPALHHCTHHFSKLELNFNFIFRSCEAYSGPQFILRKYVIGRDGKWSANYYHFKDGWCSEPIFTVTMKGVYKIGGKNALGGHNGDFTAKSFLLTPHNEKAFIGLIKVCNEHGVLV